MADVDAGGLGECVKAGGGRHLHDHGRLGPAHGERILGRERRRLLR